jgi:hypothetical protein
MCILKMNLVPDYQTVIEWVPFLPSEKREIFKKDVADIVLDFLDCMDSKQHDDFCDKIRNHKTKNQKSIQSWSKNNIKINLLEDHIRSNEKLYQQFYKLKLYYIELEQISGDKQIALINIEHQLVNLIYENLRCKHQLKLLKCGNNVDTIL